MAGAMISFICVTCISCGRTSSPVTGGAASDPSDSAAAPVVRSVISPKDGCVYHGAFLNDTITDAEIKYFEDMSGKNLDIVLKFLAFSAVESGDGFPLDEANIVSANGGVIFIKLEPWAWDPSSDPYPLSGIAAGTYDSLLRKFALKAKEYGKPVFVSFGHEMNADWYPWCEQPAAYIKAYKHVYETVNAYTNNITWVWDPNIDYDEISEYYPGSGYVDWVAVDGYNTQDYGGSWKSIEQLFLSAVSDLELLGKPVMIGETACDANSTVDEQTNKPDWLYGGISWICNHKKTGSSDNLIKAYVYFNKTKEENGKTKQWAICSADERIRYKAALSDLSSFFKGF